MAEEFAIIGILIRQIVALKANVLVKLTATESNADKKAASDAYIFLTSVCKAARFSESKGCTTLRDMKLDLTTETPATLISSMELKLATEKANGNRPRVVNTVELAATNRGEVARDIKSVAVI